MKGFKGNNQPFKLGPEAQSVAADSVLDLCVLCSAITTGALEVTPPLWLPSIQAAFKASGRKLLVSRCRNWERMVKEQGWQWNLHFTRVSPAAAARGRERGMALTLMGA